MPKTAGKPRSGIRCGDDWLDALAAELGGEDQEEAPHLDAARKWNKGWRPRLNPVQQEAYRSDAIYQLWHSERASGKTFGALCKAVEHCFLNDNALAMILVKETGQATDGGAWHKLEFEVLPTWKRGNRDRDGKRLDEGIGLVYTESKQDAQSKKPKIWVQTINGGWSQLLMVSMPVDKQVSDKVKGKEPSFILIDEAQTMESDGYFKYLIQQLGRRPGMKAPGRAIYCANPDGPSHWLYKLFFVDPIDKETGEWDKRFAQFHIPVKENISNLPPRYYEDYVLPAVRGDPIEMARMARGEWIDRQRGDSLFSAAFKPQLHVRGDAIKNRGVVPVSDQPVIVSYDPGAAHSAIHFEQIIPTLERSYKLIFDELDFVGHYMPYYKIVPRVIEKMQFWEEKTESELRWVHVSDSSAFNQFRASSGSFDATDIEQISADHVKKAGLPERFVIRLRECPKGPHSISARVRMLTDAMLQDELIVSATCVRTVQMLSQLGTDPDKPLEPDPRSPLTHKFDSATYGFFYFDKGKGRRIPIISDLKPMIYTFGSG